MQEVNSTGWFGELLAEHQAPCVSIYFPAQRAAPPANENAIRFRDLLHKAEAQPAMRLEHFMRLVDTTVWENHSRMSHLPLIVAAEVKNLSAFLGATKNPYILEQGIQIDPEHQPIDRLRDEAWKIIEPRYQE